MGFYTKIKRDAKVKSQLKTLITEKRHMKVKKKIKEAIADLKDEIFGKAEEKRKESVKDILFLARQEVKTYDIVPKVKKKLNWKKMFMQNLNDFMDSTKHSLQEKSSKYVSADLSRFIVNFSKEENPINELKTFDATTPVYKTPTHNLVRKNRSGIHLRKYPVEQTKVYPRITVKDLFNSVFIPYI